MHDHRAAALADLDGQRIGLYEPVRPTVQRPGPELLHRRVEALGQLGHLRPGHHADQRLLGPPTPFQQPLREVAALAQLRDRQLDRARPGIPPALTVAVAVVISAPRTPAHTAPRKSRPPRRQSAPAQTSAPSPAANPGSPAQGFRPPGGHHTGDIGHHALASFDEFASRSKDQHGGRLSSRQHAGPVQDPYTTPVDVNTSAGRNSTHDRSAASASDPSPFWVVQRATDNANANAVNDQAGLVIGAVDPMSGCLGVFSTPGPPDQGASFGALPPELGDLGEG